MNRCPLALSLVLLCTCAKSAPPPLGQLVLYVDTDAPVPPPPGTVESAVTTVALFDTIRFELYEGQTAISHDSRDFAVHSGLFTAKEVSIGILPDADAGAEPLLARVRMFRGDRLIDGEPPASMTLDTTVELPVLPTEGVVSIQLTLHVDDLGTTIGTLASPGRPSAGEPTASLVGTWPGGIIKRCTSTPSADEACAEGGAFWFGDPSLRGRAPDQDITAERLVVLAPYFIGLHEVTVAEFRKVWPKLSGDVAPTMYTGPDDIEESSNWCTWVETPTGADVTADLPLNCVTWGTARAYCQALGGDLPSEAEFEFAASGLGREWGYPWGDDVPSCTDAVWGQGGVGTEEPYPSECRAFGSDGWMETGGSGARDRVDGVVRRTSDSSLVVDLGGNVSEWMRDQWSRPSEAYWNQVRVFNDPVADLVSPSDGDQRSVRGGSWLTEAEGARAGVRLFNAPTPLGIGRGLGFRCVRAGG